MKTLLYIENYEIELDESVQFLLNKQFEELSNPTIIINDWSKTVNIPMTEKNNKIFGYIYKPERVIVDDGTDESYKRMSIYFDPTKKLDFRLVYNSTELMQGYAKMNDITMKEYKGTYNITLFGLLGRIFQELKKITFVTTTEDPKYLIDGSTWVDEVINKELVYSSWNSEGQLYATLQPKYIIPGPGASPVLNPAYHVTDIIGFAPNNAFSEGFEYTTFLTTINESKEFKQVLTEANFEDFTGINPETVIPNGMLPREIGEYRSYYQLPFIYWNKLFQIFLNKAEEITGYTFELSEEWFNNNNPYWHNLVYMLKPLNTIKNNTYTNTYDSPTDSSLIVYLDTTERFHYRWDSCETGFYWGVNTEYFPLLKDANHFQLEDGEVLSGHISAHFKMDVSCNLGSSMDVHIRNNSGFVVEVYLTDDNETINQPIGNIFVKWDESSYYPYNYDYVVNVPTTTIPAGYYVWTLFDLDFGFDIPSTMANTDVKITYKLSGYNAETILTGSLFVNTNPSSVDLGNITLYGSADSLQMVVLPLNGKSFSEFILNDLWNNDYNLFDEIIKYCKMYRIHINVDAINKKLKFIPLTKFFEDYSIVDWTNKVDRSKDFVIKPVSLDSKYVLFNYDENETALALKYKDKYGLNYGEYKLSTSYNFNSETTPLFENVKTSITNSDNVLSWENLYTYHNIIYSFPGGVNVYNKDKDKKLVDIFGSYYFHNGLSYFSSDESLHLRPVKLSDDSPFLQLNNTYFYTQNVLPSLDVSTYPHLDVVNGNNMCLFSIPKENYTYQTNYGDKHTIYYNFWKNYIDERYNIQNKVVTCYLTLTPKDWINFQFSNFIVIDDVLYIVNKIYDYNIEVPEPTKVDLVTISNISGYTS